jgi:hypothetical protein
MKTLTILLIFLSSVCTAQIDTTHRSFIHNFFHQFATTAVVEKKDLVVYGMQLIAGAADGMNQALVYHGALKGHPFWDYSTSWKRKYKDYDHGDTRSRFPGSKTWAVGITDGNHLTRMINRSFTTGSIMFAMSEHDPWYEIVKEAIFASIINRIGFSYVYDKVFKVR